MSRYPIGTGSQLPELTVLGCDDTAPAVALVAAALVVLVVAEVFVLAEPAEVDVVVAFDDETVAFD
ncbi:MAG: hypothetical protein QOF28_1727 [Actinomycetota bacterium]|nr:hypothetical protein [Actinomycetota bacterium]